MKQLFDKDGTQVNLLQDSDIESSTNYIKFPDGTLIVFMRSSVYTGDSQKIQLPIPFTNDANDIVVNVCGNWDSTITIANVYQSDVYINAISKNNYSTCEFFLIAIGRWK